MANPLYNVPGLGGYLAAQDRRSARDQQAMETQAGQMKLADYMQTRDAGLAKQKKLQEIAQLSGGDPMKAQQLFMQAGMIEEAKQANAMIPKVEKPERMPDFAQLISIRDAYAAKGDTRNVELIDAHLKKQNEGLPRQNSTNPYFTPVQTANGVMSFDARTGGMSPINVGGAPVVGSASDPALQGAIAGAKQTGEAQAKRAMNMSGINNVISEARSLLSGSSGKAKPTGSGFGTAYDATAGFFGASPEGAAEAQTLRAIGGALTSKMPRMEGPQSDKDTQLYKEMSAVVGDSTIPTERRLAALAMVEELWVKYSSDQQPAQQPGQPAKRIKFDAQGNQVQ